MPILEIVECKDKSFDFVLGHDIVGNARCVRTAIRMAARVPHIAELLLDGNVRWMLLKGR